LATLRAVFVYQLIHLYRFEASGPLRACLKLLLQAA
jgi:hypothetical protein